MTVYLLDQNNCFMGEQTIDPMSALPKCSITPPPEIHGDEVAYYIGSQWTVLPTYPSPVIVAHVPQTITPRQARLALLQATLLDEVELLIANDRAMQIWWEYSLEIDRNNEHIITMSTALGLTESQLDDLLILGASL